MVVKEIDEVAVDVTQSGNAVSWLVEKTDGSQCFEIRKICIPPGKCSSYGSHSHEHGVYVLSGSGYIVGKDTKKLLTPQMSVFVPGNEEHQWINASSNVAFEFICVIPSGAEDIIKQR